MKTYTLDQFRLYLQRSDSLGDALYYLKQFDEVINAEEPDEEYTEEECDYEVDLLNEF